MMAIALVLGAGARDFVHPGIAESAEDIARARKMIAEKREPWYGCFKALESCWSADPNQRVPEYPTVLESVRCNATIGQAGRRAHDLALMYRLTDDVRYAKKAVEFLNASSHYTELKDVGTGPLDFGKIYLLVSAAELLRYDANWEKADKVRFAKMLRDVFYPQIKNGDKARFGNQGLFAYRGALAIAIFLNDEKKYDRIWRYLNGLPHRDDQEAFASGPAIADANPQSETEFQNDYRLRGHAETIPDYGYDEVLKYYIYANGQSQEASRDQAHAVCGVFMYVDIAEMFRMQGDDTSQRCSECRATICTELWTTASSRGSRGSPASTLANGGRAATPTKRERRLSRTGSSTARGTARDAGSRLSRIRGLARTSAGQARPASVPMHITARRKAFHWSSLNGSGARATRRTRRTAGSRRGAPHRTGTTNGRAGAL